MLASGVGEESKIDLEGKEQVSIPTRASVGMDSTHSSTQILRRTVANHVSVLSSALPTESYRTISGKTRRVLRLFYASLLLPGVFPEAHNLLYSAGCSGYLSGWEWPSLKTQQREINQIARKQWACIFVGHKDSIKGDLLGRKQNSLKSCNLQRRWETEDPTCKDRQCSFISTTMLLQTNYLIIMVHLCLEIVGSMECYYGLLPV